MSATAQYLELRIQKGIRQAEDDLVLWIQDALDTCEYGKAGRNKLEEAQFRNLVRVADTTSSPEVIKNFVRYQVGRDDKWGRGKNSLAERIVTDINTQLKTKAVEILKEAKVSQTDTTTKDSNAAASDSDSSESQAIPDMTRQETNEVHIELVRRYLGYGARYLKYLNNSSANK